MVLLWKKVEARKCWYVRWNHDGWDGHVLTGRKWPDGEITVDTRHRKRLFWPMRRAVDAMLNKLEEGTPC